MTDKDALLAFAARLDQFIIEVKAWANSKSTGFFAGHEAMVAMMRVASAARYLSQTAARYDEATPK